MSDASVVALATDRGFVFPVSVALASLARYYHGRVAVVTADVEDDDRKLLAEAAGHLDLEWIEPEEKALRGLPSRYLSASTYHRLLLPELIPDASRIVYIDGDVLIRRPIDDLVFHNLGDHPIAAVRNLRAPWLAAPDGLQAWGELGLQPTAFYFNAGVLVIDAVRWRAEQLTTATLETATYLDRIGRLPQMDQDALNAQFAGNWSELDYTWNQHPLVFQPRGFHHVLLEQDTVAQLRSNPAIAHFIGRSKPWQAGCTHPFAAEWHALATSVDPLWRPEHRSLPERVLSRLSKAGRALLGR